MGSFRKSGVSVDRTADGFSRIDADWLSSVMAWLQIESKTDGSGQMTEPNIAVLL